jgi:hypothetical protein
MGVISMVRDSAPDSASALPGVRLLTMTSVLLRPHAAAFSAAFMLQKSARLPNRPQLIY